MYLVSTVELMFRGQVILFTPVIVYNTEHHEYPRGGMVLEKWSNMAKEIVSTITERYQGIESVKRHMENPINSLTNSLKVCFIRPIQNSFENYSHFELN